LSVVLGLDGVVLGLKGGWLWVCGCLVVGLWCGVGGEGYVCGLRPPYPPVPMYQPTCLVV
jgi:hypothetical protein